MSTSTAIITALKTQLEDSDSLSYVKDVFLGVRDNVTQFPCIIIEPLGSEESDAIYPSQEIVLLVAVHGFIRIMDKDLQIIGSGAIKGVMDFENDIKKALSEDRRLGISGSDVNVTIGATRMDYEAYPVRNLVVEVKIYFRQPSEART
ncbi:MAG: hypothetical protein M0P69_04415 [Bacteroidales bacterium]|nr:hypothetical protein [Bacteroidales bacterium]